MKSKKGITLIALIITIIVMLILVGVTVTVSLNGGLFTTAKEATDDTQIAQEKEELLMAALGALNENGKVDIGKLDSSLPEGFTGSNWEYTSKTGNTFTVSENGSITLAGGSSEEEPEIPVTPPATQISFTLDGTTYTTEEGTTWIDWITENDMTEYFDPDFGDNSLIYRNAYPLTNSNGELVWSNYPIVADDYIINTNFIW